MHILQTFRHTICNQALGVTDMTIRAVSLCRGPTMYIARTLKCCVIIYNYQQQGKILPRLLLKAHNVIYMSW